MLNINHNLNNANDKTRMKQQIATDNKCNRNEYQAAKVESFV